MLRVRFLGQYKVELDGAAIEISSRPARSLLAYLILNAGTVQRREKLAGLFWPDSNEANARSNLRHALWRVRKTLETDQTTEDGYLVADEETITFKADCDCWLDAATLARKGDEGESIDDLVESISLYQGELLPGFYDDWVLLERERLQSVFEHKMQLLLDRLVAVQRWPEVLAWGEQWIALGQTPEPAYRALMLAHSGLGDRSNMVAVYERCVAALQQELGVAPSSQTQALYERLLSGEEIAAMLASDLTDLRGQAIGPYRVVEQLGAGGMAEVYKAYQPRLDRYVALKFIKPELVNQVDFRARFEREARLLGQLNHPHIVHVYDFGEAGQHYYLAMEYVAGGTLKDWLNKAHQVGQVMATEQVATILGQVSAALDYAHQQGIIHRDLKPANVMLTPDGRALLTDFGLAKMVGGSDDLSQTGSTTGTPAYMAPEQIEGDAEQLGPASDLYSLGVVLYELLTGQLPFRADTPLALMNMHLNEPVPAPRTVNPDLPEAVEQVLFKALAKAPEQRYQQAETLAQAFNAALSSAAMTEVSPGRVPAHRLLTWWPLAPAEPAPHLGQPPFKGLQYFDEADADFFFGRELLTAELVAHLSVTCQEEGEGSRFLAVVGASGSGKSSLVRAGLVPALRRGEPLADDSLPPAGSTAWPIHVITPTAHPLEALATSLTREAESVTATATLIDDLAQEPRSLHLYVQRLLSSDQETTPNGEDPNRLLVVVDQFEELFTLCRDEAERRVFVDNLLTAAGIGLMPTTPGGAADLTRDGPTLVVITLRADFYAHCGQFDRLREALAQHQLYIGPMTGAELRRAVEGPAQQGGWDFEPGLVDLLLQDVGDEPGALPLLSHALLETWQRRRGRTMTFGGYSQSGRVQGAIAQTAERVLQALTPAQQVIARRIFLRLTELGEGTQDTRRRATLSELVPRAEENRAVGSVVQKLADARLITTSEESVEVAHEALIREWPSLRQWLDENREALQFHRHLTEAAQAWTRLERDPGELYRGARLVQAGEWAEAHAAEMNPLEQEFLEASQALARQHEVEREARRRRVIQGLSAGLVMVMILLILAGWQWRRATQERHAAQTAQATAAAERDQAQNSLSRQLAVQALTQMDDRLDLALLLGVEAARTADTTEARGSLLTLLDTNRQLITFLRDHTDFVRSVAFSPDGKTLASGSNDRSIILWDVASGQPLGPPLVGHTDTVRSVTFSPDGQTLASGSFDGTIILWDVASRQPLGPPMTDHTDGVWSVAFSSDGQTLASSSADHTIILWDVETGQSLGPPLTGHHSPVTDITFSADGQILASAGIDNSIILWDVTSAQPLGRPLIGPADAVRSIALSPDGQILASGANNIVILWDVAARQPLGSPLTGHAEAVWSVAFSPDGQTLASSDVAGSIILWDVATRQALGPPLTGHLDTVWSVVFSPDGQTMASGSSDNTIILWNLDPPHLLSIRLTGHTDAVNTVAFSPAITETRTLPPGAGGQTLASGSSDTTIILWDVATRQPLHPPLTGHKGEVMSVAYSPNGETLASGSADKTIILWDMATRQLLGPPLSSHKGGVTSLAFSPDGQTLATGSLDSTVILWDVTTRQPITPPLMGHTAGVRSVAFSPDGQILASGSEDETIILWDVAARRPFGPPLTGHIVAIFALAFSPDGRLLASGGGFEDTFILWNVVDVRPSSEAQSLSLYRISDTGDVSSIAYGPDARVLALGSWFSTVTLWDVAGGHPLGPSLTGHTDSVTSVAFSPDGQTLASASDDHSIMLWNTSLESWQARACRRVNRNMTRTEWQQFFGDQPYRATCPELPAPEG